MRSCGYRLLDFGLLEGCRVRGRRSGAVAEITTGRGGYIWCGRDSVRGMADRTTGTKARRRADQALVATYHQARLADLLEHLREGFAEYDAGRIDAFQLDDIIHQYKRATIELWKFCVVSGSRLEFVARTLERWREDKEETDWWERAAPQRRGR
jgi:hypothetical protein